MDYDGKFYIGKTYDIKAKKTLDDLVLYDPDDLTTHGVVVGMTGSGKTGLCIDILEEAALKGIPALLVDPKGDIGNLLLHFPDLAPSDFEPWVDPDGARREGKSVEQLAAEISAMWRKGLSSWGITPERIEEVRTAVDYAVYTPGSDAGIPISVMSSLGVPDMPWEEDEDLLREKISSTVSALLGLVGIEADPVRSREHILLANIFEHFWRAGQDLDLVSLIQHTQNPPFERLGAMSVDQVFPSKERFELAMALNNLLASPSFQAWTEGEPLDIQSLLWSPDGRPRQSVFYLGHLADSERMFFVTLLLTALETWVRTQPGSTSLRALLYFDEVFGFLPPVAMPPSKPPMLRLLKQARAFGFGLLLATQNPVDLDYKALSNAGTWFVGRLQTEQDKARLLDGLESAAEGKGGFKRSKADKIVSDLGKRTFLLHNVHDKAPQIFQTRWAMAYLKGPITRSQLGTLNDLVGAKVRDAQEVAEAATRPSETLAAAPIASTAGTAGGAILKARPALPAGVEELFLPNNLTASQALSAGGRDTSGAAQAKLVYRPVLLAQAMVRYLNRKINLDHEQSVTAMVSEPDRRGFVRWEENLSPQIDTRMLDRGAAPSSSFAELKAPLNDPKLIKNMRKDFMDYVFHGAELRLASNTNLNLVAAPGITEEEFRDQCEAAADEAFEVEVEKLKAKIEKKLKSLEDKLKKEERELAEDEAEHSGRKMEEAATGLENIIGLFTGSRSRRGISSSLTKRRMTAKAKADVEESREVIEQLEKDIAKLEAETAEELESLQKHWDELAEDIQETTYKPFKKDILLDIFGVAWSPVWRIGEGASAFEVPGFSREG